MYPRATCRSSPDIIQSLLKAVLIRGSLEDVSKGRSGVYDSGVGRMGSIGLVLRDTLILLDIIKDGNVGDREGPRLDLRGAVWCRPNTCYLVGLDEFDPLYFMA